MDAAQYFAVYSSVPGLLLLWSTLPSTLPDSQVLRIYIHFHMYIFFFFINSRIIAFLFPANELPENCILSPWQRNHELAILPSLQLAIGSSLMCWKPYGLLSLLFLLLLPWKLQVEKDQLLTPRTNGDFVQERNNDGERPSALPWLPPKTFSFQLPPVLRLSVICICSFLLCGFFFFCTSLFTYSVN